MCVCISLNVFIFHFVLINFLAAMHKPSKNKFINIISQSCMFGGYVKVTVYTSI